MNENIERNANAVQSHFYLSGQKCVKDHKYLELLVVWGAHFGKNAGDDLV